MSNATPNEVAEQVTALRRVIAAQYRFAFAAIRRAKAKRAWLNAAAKTNPGLRQFYGENLDLLCSAERKIIARCRSQIARLEAAAFAAEIAKADSSPVFAALEADIARHVARRVAA